MPTIRELVVAALHVWLQPLTALNLRDEVLPERIPAAGLIILRDGQPGEPEVTLLPLRHHYQHRAELEVVVQAGTGRASAFDDLIAAIGAALEVDRTLGGLCDWVEAKAPASVDLPVEGAGKLKAAVIRLNLHYTTTGPWPDTLALKETPMARAHGARAQTALAFKTNYGTPDSGYRLMPSARAALRAEQPL